MSRRASARSAMCCGHGSCCSPRPARRTPRSRSGWASARTRPASGGAGSASSGWPDWPTAPRPGGRACSPPSGGRGQGPGLRTARRELNARWPAGPAPSWPAMRRPADRSPRRLRVHRAPLAGRRRAQALAAPVLDLPPRPALRAQGRPRPGPLRSGVWEGRAARRGRVRAQRRREARRPGPHAASTPPCPPGPGGRCGPRASTTAAAPWPTWPPTTSTAPRSSAGASRPPASCRSPRSSTRS